MSKTYSYPITEILMWALVAAGAGIVLLLLGIGLPIFVPQESISTTRWLEVLTGSATGQQTFNIPLTRTIFVILGERRFKCLAILVQRLGVSSPLLSA